MHNFSNYLVSEQSNELLGSIDNQYSKAIFIREVENTLLKLFSENKLNGTVHTCCGQEFSALAVCSLLTKNDTVVSNHRCHGHYLAFKNNPKRLIAELLGKATGLCGGIGSSQHLYDENFFSNGIQGGMLPVAAGISLAKKLDGYNSICAAFIGDGTLGEGIIYETFNLVSLWNLPLLIVCENNKYAQSTKLEDNLAGDILKRPQSFGIQTFECNTWKLNNLYKTAEEAISYVRESNRPAFLLVDTYRLNAHSKGDDTRDESEINFYKMSDPINNFEIICPDKFKEYKETAAAEIALILDQLENEPVLKIEEYCENILHESDIAWNTFTPNNVRISELIYEFLKNSMSTDVKIVLLGEDLSHPYGGAFKVSKDLSKLYPDKVFSTSISEGAIVGIANGLALSNYRPVAEIMFGDFITLTLDQIINHAAKFYRMYNKQISCPIIIRTPMGGGRGYGPTHSQSLEKLLMGISDVKLISLNAYIDSKYIYENVLTHERNPVIVIENKKDYAKVIDLPKTNKYKIEISSERYTTVKAAPIGAEPDLTIVTFGGMASTILDMLEEIIVETDFIPEVFVISKLYPLSVTPFIASVERTKKLVTIEEGSATSGIGSEIISHLNEQTDHRFKSLKIGALDLPIPATSILESEVLPNRQRIIYTINDYWK